VANFWSFPIEFQVEFGKLIFVRATNCLSVGISLWLLFSAVGSARPIQCWFPEQLEPKATLICNGTVISVEDTGIKKNLSYPYFSPSDNEEMVMLAKIKVLRIFKGLAPTEIEFQYRVSTQMVPDGAEHIQLEKGKRYRFFLKPGYKPNHYVGVLEGNFDDNSAIEALSPGESYDNPYLQKKDAVKIAVSFAKSTWHVGEKFDPAVECSYCEPNIGGTEWIVVVNDLPPQSRSATIMVMGDRKIDLNRTEFRN